MTTCAFCTSPVGAWYQFRQFIELVKDHVSCVVVLGDVTETGDSSLAQFEEFLREIPLVMYVVPAYKLVKPRLAKKPDNFFSAIDYLYGNNNKVVSEKKVVFLPGDTLANAQNDLLVVEDSSRVGYFSKRYMHQTIVELEKFTPLLRKQPLLFSCTPPHFFSWQLRVIYTVAEQITTQIEVGGERKEVTYHPGTVVTRQEADELETLGFSIADREENYGSKKLAALVKKFKIPFVVAPNIHGNVTSSYTIAGRKQDEHVLNESGIILVGHLQDGYGAVVDFSSKGAKFHTIFL